MKAFLASIALALFFTIGTIWLQPLRQVERHLI
jgi:hypothetical protein